MSSFDDIKNRQTPIGLPSGTQAQNDNNGYVYPRPHPKKDNKVLVTGVDSQAPHKQALYLLDTNDVNAKDVSFWEN
jgi:hypothetical protein